ncbi:MAG TPA: FMN-binding protein [Polyangiaceae bacterium]|nr:FMN-binding protein [Polyangiaceae bacterium]
MALLVLLVGGCAPLAARGGPIDARRLNDGVFTGSAGHIDKATVSLTVQDHRVTSVTLESFFASPVGQKARDVIPQRIVERQSTKVDVVSGATEASHVIMNAADEAVKKSYAASEMTR